MSYISLLYHIVFSTKERRRTIVESHERELYAYIMGIIHNKGGHLYRIGGMPDHIHIVATISPQVSLSDMVKTIKQQSSRWLKDHEAFPQWEKWEEGYGAFTYAMSDLDTVVNYVRRQKEHHQTTSFADEFRAFLIEANIPFDDKYLPR
ncbi:MAG: IS200/IS605 family transposase [Bacteroidaceae bacterium]|nr:IS200/IS605 family transposase [Bacteroidaceae bacterium]